MLIRQAALFLVLMAGGVMAIEEPEYTVRSRSEHFEVRQYPKLLVAQTLIDSDFDNAGNQAFRILADFIFGNNQSQAKIDMTAPVSQTAASEKIAMTAPVSQVKEPKGFIVQFAMPASYSLDTLPKPNDPRVQIRELPARTVAVYEYSGSWSENRFNEKLSAFRQALEKAGLKTKGEPVFARFNSPFRPWFLRRNEIWLELTDSP